MIEDEKIERYIMFMDQETKIDMSARYIQIYRLNSV